MFKKIDSNDKKIDRLLSSNYATVNSDSGRSISDRTTGDNAH